MNTETVSPRDSASRDAVWPETLKTELVANGGNPHVGTRLLSVDDRVRVWEIRLAPGERIGFHRHVLDYFWTAVTPGKAVSHQGDGTTVEANYLAGETQHHVYGPGEFKIHDLENAGATELIFMTVEFLNGANSPLPLAMTTTGAT